MPSSNIAHVLSDPDLRQKLKSQRASRKSLTSIEDGDEFINPDEFEEIAEIYDSIRLLHSKIHPAKDLRLAQEFDQRLREVMENLSEAVNNDNLDRTIKVERSLTAKFDLLTMCSEKLCDYIKDQ